MIRVSAHLLVAAALVPSFLAGAAIAGCPCLTLHMDYRNSFDGTGDWVPTPVSISFRAPLATHAMPFIRLSHESYRPSCLIEWCSPARAELIPMGLGTRITRVSSSEDEPFLDLAQTFALARTRVGYPGSTVTHTGLATGVEAGVGFGRMGRSWGWEIGVHYILRFGAGRRELKIEPSSEFSAGAAISFSVAGD